MIYSSLLDQQERQAVANVLKNRPSKSQIPVTLDSLITQWAHFVRSVERGYQDSIYEYTNDLSVRNILEDILISVNEQTRLKLAEMLRPLDEQFNKATKKVERALAPGVKPGGPSWYFRVPKRLSQELENDLRSEGVID